MKMVSGSVLALLLTSSALAQNAALSPPAKYDQDESGFVEPGRELEIYVLHLESEILAKYDGNLNGVLDPGEAEQLSEDEASTDTVPTMGDLTDVIGTDRGLPVAAASGPPTLPKTEDKKRTSRWSYVVQNRYEPGSIVATPQEIENRDLTRVTPATATFKRDFLSTTNSYSVSGAAFGYWRTAIRYPGEGGTDAFPKPVDYALTAGVEFDRTIIENTSAGEVDALALRFGGEVAFEQADALITGHYLGAHAGWLTDFDFGLSVLSLKADYTPISPQLLTAVPYKIPGTPVRLFWRPILTAEYQSVLDDDGRPEFEMADDYLFVGPSIKGSVQFAEGSALDRLELNVEYLARFDVLNADNHYDLLTADASWALDEKKNYSVTVAYRDGSVPITREDVEDIVLGIGVRF